ncbi:MAG: hypothetical protein RMJ33_01255 [Saprospiraceae bacterium]|nr:hypothetical protein [Saprospiraceae bacterium]MDW8228437.1 hypothetical protein [Saprospiraceae bacterium]
MDALLLAENCFVVPDDNIIYEDSDIEYDPEFDEVAWGRPTSFKEAKEPEGVSDVAELVVRVPIRNEEMKEWIAENREKMDRVMGKLLEDLYETEQLLKG